jgi:excisionase family DNA binding protein
MKNISHSIATGDHSMALLTIRQVAFQLQVHEESVRRWLRAKRLIGIKAGRSWRISEEEIQRVSMTGGI